MNTAKDEAVCIRTVKFSESSQIVTLFSRNHSLARHNPQPAYFAARLENRSDREAAIAIALDAADWILEASVLYGREMLTHDGSKHRIVNYRHEEKLEPGGGRGVHGGARTPGLDQPPRGPHSSTGKG